MVGALQPGRDAGWPWRYLVGVHLPGDESETASEAMTMLIQDGMCVVLVLVVGMLGEGTAGVVLRGQAAAQR